LHGQSASHPQRLVTIGQWADPPLARTAQALARRSGERDLRLSADAAVRPLAEGGIGVIWRIIKDGSQTGSR
jgi:hypothetical protein